MSDLDLLYIKNTPAHRASTCISSPSATAKLLQSRQRKKGLSTVKKNRGQSISHGINTFYFNNLSASVYNNLKMVHLIYKKNTFE